MSFSGTIKAAVDASALDEVVRLAHIIWREHYTPIIGRAQVEYMLGRGYTPAALAAEQAAGSRFLLACDGSQAVGYAGWAPDADDPGMAWLDKFYVLREARGAGVATALLQRVVTDTRAATLKLRVNRDNTGAIAAYRRLGFAIEGADVKPIGGGFVMDDYIMRRTAEARCQAQFSRGTR